MLTIDFIFYHIIAIIMSISLIDLSSTSQQHNHNISQIVSRFYCDAKCVDCTLPVVFMCKLYKLSSSQLLCTIHARSEWSCGENKQHQLASSSSTSTLLFMQKQVDSVNSFSYEINHLWKRCSKQFPTKCEWNFACVWMERVHRAK